jgi:hypothetical protein
MPMPKYFVRVGTERIALLSSPHSQGSEDSSNSSLRLDIFRVIAAASWHENPDKTAAQN